MFTPHFIPVPALLADRPVWMPLNIQLAIPDYVTADTRQSVFNLPAAINELMGAEGWKVASGVLNPQVWAPGWDDEQLRDFVTRPFGESQSRLPDEALSDLRADEFVGISADPSRSFWSTYEIVHFVGGAGIGNRLELAVSSTGSDDLAVGALRDALVNAETRLLILQMQTLPETGWYMSRSYEAARLFGTYLAGSGGPAVLTVLSNDAEPLDRYFMDLYAGIVHNQSLSSAAANAGEDLTVDLYVAQNGDDLLRFDRFSDDLYSRIRELQRPDRFSINKVEARAEPKGSTELAYHRAAPTHEKYDVFEAARPYLHERQLHDLEERASELQTSFDETAAETFKRISIMEHDLNWSRESGAAIPLARTAQTLPDIEHELASLSLSYSQELVQRAYEQAERAPRVVNANFAYPNRDARLHDSSIEPGHGLVMGQEYDLWLDIGPQWNVATSIVQGSNVFPEQALPVPVDEGWSVQVAFVSEDFLPRMSTAEIWVPAKTGRSYPVIQGEKTSESGPISLRVTAPTIPNEQQQFMEARGRLCIYFGNNLLQSAIVKAAIVRSADVLPVGLANQIDFDFNVGTSFQELDRFKTRTMGVDEEAARNWLLGRTEEYRDSTADDSLPQTELPVALNLTLNDDGVKHRILVKNDPTLPPVWKPYNVAATTRLLGQAHQELSQCFSLHDAQCDLTPGSNGKGLSPDNGKDYQQFACDLRRLAILGERLFNNLLDKIDLNGTGLTRADWERSLQRSLLNRAVIQVARTGDAEYAFPWALVYDYPLPDQDDLRYCDLISEWNAAGVRVGEVDTQCPHALEAWHRKNVLCPYGFWGLKHEIEQPISRLVDGNLPATEPPAISIGGALRLSVGVTRDPHLPKATIDQHLKNLAAIGTLTPPNGADDWTAVQTMLKSPNDSPDIVYFLCHGEYDDKRDEPFLGIGLPDGQNRYRVYPNGLIGWSRTMPPPSPVWQKPQPLVFINGCETFKLSPEQVLNFVSTFGGLGASGVIGTEISVLLPLATEIGELLFDAFVKTGMSLGQAMHQIRWKLANKGNLLGLAYTPYGLTDLKIVKA